MRTLALVVLLGAAAAAQAGQAGGYTPAPANPPHADEETLLNARIVSVDTAAGRITVRGVDVRADGGRDETFTVAGPLRGRLGEVHAGTNVLLVLRGTTVMEVRPSPA